MERSEGRVTRNFFVSGIVTGMAHSIYIIVLCLPILGSAYDRTIV